MVIDALVNQLVIQREIKVENTEQAFKELSKIFHEIEPTVADALRTMYGSSIQEVVDEYNKVEYALEDAMKNAPVEAPSPVPFPNYDEPTTPPATSQQAEEQGKRVYVAPEMTIKSISTEHDTASDLSDKQILLGLDENNNQDPNAVKEKRPYDSTSQYSEFNYLTSKVKDYIKSMFGIKEKSFGQYVYSFIVRGINSKIAKLSIADTGGYVNDFQVKENDKGVVITPKHSDMLTRDKLSKAGEEVIKKCYQ